MHHRGLTPERWNALSLLEQMANVGSEVERTISWRNRGNEEYAMRAFERTLELLDFTLADPKHQGRRKEIARVREASSTTSCSIMNTAPTRAMAPLFSSICRRRPISPLTLEV